MGYLDNLKARLGNADNLREVQRDSTKVAINSNFSDHPSYTTFKVNDYQTDGIVDSSKSGDMRIVLFRPGLNRTNIYRGCYVTIDNELWLLTDLSGNDVYPKAMLQRCNETIVWVNGAKTNSYGCAVNSNATLYQFGFVPDKMMQVVNMEFHAFLPYDVETAKIKENFRFVVAGRSFVVSAIDSITTVVNGKGIMRVHLKADIIRDADNLVTKVADNSKPTSGGGKLW